MIGISCLGQQFTFAANEIAVFGDSRVGKLAFQFSNPGVSFLRMIEEPPRRSAALVCGAGLPPGAPKQSC